MDVGEGVKDMGQGVDCQVLGLEVSAIDRPMSILVDLFCDQELFKIYQLTK